jgi:hypothetical protein
VHDTRHIGVGKFYAAVIAMLGDRHAGMISKREPSSPSVFM